jgi:hypothetical protein
MSTKSNIMLTLAGVLLVVLSWFIGGAIVAVSLALAGITPKFVKKLMNSGTQTKQYESSIQNMGKKYTASISHLYEMQWANHETNREEYFDREDTLRSYKDLMDGKVLDRDLIHKPSKKVNGLFNKDIIRYFEVQRVLFLENDISVERIDNELKALRHAKEVEEVAAKYREEFINSYDIDEGLVRYMITEDRMLNFKAEEWKLLASKVKEFTSEYSTRAVAFYVSCFDKPFDDSDMKSVDHLMGLNAPTDLICSTIDGKLSMDEAHTVLELIEDGYDLSSAKALVAKAGLANYREQEAREFLGL